jgi:hypothetical protein
MDDFDIEGVWRKALQARGKDWVRSELHRRPGRPEDTLYDVVFKEPYPTRAFCFQWCAEEENRIFRVSWHTFATIMALALLIVSILKGISAWSDAEQSLQILNARATAHAGGSKSASSNGNTLTNDIPSMSMSSSTVPTSTSTGTTSSSPGTTSPGTGTTSSGSALTTGQSSLSSTCGYITYASPRCQH